VAEAKVESLAPRKKVFGELKASKRSTIAAEEGGIVREIVVREGGRVDAGAVIARLDDARVKLEIGANDAALAAARATADERGAMVVREERDLELMRKAQAQGGTNPREMSDAESALAIARAQAAQAKAALMVIEQQGALLAKRLKDLEVRAPYAGAVTKLRVDEGAWVGDGGAVVDFVGVDSFDGWFDVPQEFLGAANDLVKQAATKTERAVPLEIQTTAGARIMAVGIRVVPEIDPRSRTFHAVTRIMRDDSALADGLALVAFVPQGAPQQWTLVPKDALVYQGTNAGLFVVQNGVAVPVQVRVAFPMGDMVALEAGAVAAGAQVVVEGNERLMPMSPVAPVSGDAAGAAK
jgi:RND family efflux transporter MFP subunit